MKLYVLLFTLIAGVFTPSQAALYSWSANPTADTVGLDKQAFENKYKGEQDPDFKINTETDKTGNDGNIDLKNDSVCIYTDPLSNPKNQIMDGEFSLGISYTAASLTSPSTLFTATFGSAIVDISFDPKDGGTFDFKYKGEGFEPPTFSLNSIGWDIKDFATNNDKFTIMMSVDAQGIILLKLYANSLLICTAKSTQSSGDKQPLNNITIGGDGSNLSVSDIIIKDGAMITDEELISIIDPESSTSGKTIETSLNTNITSWANMGDATQSVPEPSIALLSIVGLAGMMVKRRR
ncbi:MAG: PEP-CTERM sorting domain-containing protein [Akkermansia sp.]